jgi:hypothetical protein
MKIVRHCAKLKLHNLIYFSFLSKVFVKADTFFLSPQFGRLSFVIKYASATP